MKELKLLHVLTREEWRAWLAEHHDREAEVWLVFFKQHTGKPRVDYGDAVEEALCFGWIDSIVRRLDDERYAQKFTPRRVRSKWSESNLKRYARLLAAGRVAAPGLARRPPAADPDAAGVAATAAREAAAAAAAVLADIEAALRSQGAAGRNFARMAPSHRRAYVHWIGAAKRPETRARRIAEAVERLASNLPLGLK